jgi:hypothetical protein
MSNMRESLFQIEVLDFSKRRQVYHSEDVVSKTITNRDKTQKQTRLKVIDTEPIAPTRTLFKRAKDSELAKRYGGRFGTVISCFKVDISTYLENIEHLNLEPTPITLEAEPEYVLTKALELDKPRRKIQGIKIVDGGIDKSE